MSDKQQLFNIVDSLEDAQITTLLSIAKLLYTNTPTHSLSKQEAFSIVKQFRGKAAPVEDENKALTEALEEKYESID